MTNSSATLNDQSWKKILDLLRSESQQTGNSTLNALANTLEMQVDASTEPEPDAIGLAGLPGAGKSFAAEKMANIIGAEVVSMGDAIRTEFEKTYHESPESEELGEFAAGARDETPRRFPSG